MVAWTGQAVMIVVVNSEGGVVSFTQRSGKSRWIYILVFTGQTFQNPAVTVASDGTVLISVSDKQGGLYSLELPAGTDTWTSLTVAPGLCGAPSVATWDEGIALNTLGLITATQAGTVYFWWQDLGGTSWHQETVATPEADATYTGASVTASSKHVIVTAATTFGGIDAWSQPVGDTGWSPSTVVPFGGTHYSRPEIAWTGPIGGTGLTYDVITAASQSGRLSYWWTTDGLGAWRAEKIAGASRYDVYAHPAVSVTGKSVIVTAINTKLGDVEHWYRKYGKTPWHNQLVAKG